jgi:hypothetical protein
MLNKDLYDRVKILLQLDSRLRESDSLLMARVWWNDATKLNKFPDEISGTELLILISDKKLSSYESITRARRKVMEECPELRGKNYTARKKKANDVKNQINDWNKHII